MAGRLVPAARACRFARAKSSKSFKGTAAFGYDHLVRNTFFGFRVQVRCADEGPLAPAGLTAADVHDLVAVRAVLPPGGGVGIGDRNYHGGDHAADLLRAHGFALLAPSRNKARDPNPERSTLLRRARRLIETVIGQLTERFHCKRTWARDVWHLCHRLIRKFLSHTAAVVLNIQAGNPPLQFDLLLDP